MKNKVLRFISEATDLLLLTLPVGWVINIYDGGWERFQNGDELFFLYNLIASCFFAFILIAAGCAFSDMWPKQDGPRSNSRAFYLVVELAVLITVTYWIV